MFRCRTFGAAGGWSLSKCAFYLNSWCVADFSAM